MIAKLRGQSLENPRTSLPSQRSWVSELQVQQGLGLSCSIGEELIWPPQANEHIWTHTLPHLHHRQKRSDCIYTHVATPIYIANTKAELIISSLPMYLYMWLSTPITPRLLQEKHCSHKSINRLFIQSLWSRPSTDRTSYHLCPRLFQYALWGNQIMIPGTLATPAVLVESSIQNKGKGRGRTSSTI